MTTNVAIAEEALARARGNMSVANYAAIFEGFAGKGIAEHEIEPRVNVLTYHAWRALGRQVRKGEHGIKIFTYVEMSKKEVGDDGAETVATFKRPRTTTVFHVTQTDPIAQGDHDFARKLARNGAAIGPNGAHYKIVLLGDDSRGIERVINGVRETFVGPEERRYSQVAAEQWAIADATS